jgi:tRNA pseudouridine38-40 synthase
MAAHFDWEGEPLDCLQTCYRLNRLLPNDIAVNRMEIVDKNMHARFSAKWRTYHYYIHTNKDPFQRHYSLETHYELDFEIMNRAGDILTKQNDFAAFCKVGADNKTTLCDLKECRWIKTDDNSWYMTITANRFLRNMVRAVVGTMFLLGRHKITLEEFEEIIQKGNRNNAGESMPANALFLWDIVY